MAEMLSEIIVSLPEYRRQYFGIVIGDSKRVLVNCFRMDDRLRDLWTKQLILHNTGGGSDYWRIQFDVDTKTYMEFSVNSPE